jgi:hypothetical protein
MMTVVRDSTDRRSKRYSITFLLENRAIELGTYYVGSWYDPPYLASFTVLTVVAMQGRGLERSPNRLPVLRGGFHYHFLHLLLDKPFPQQLQRCNCSGLLPYQLPASFYGHQFPLSYTGISSSWREGGFAGRFPTI